MRKVLPGVVCGLLLCVHVSIAGAADLATNLEAPIVGPAKWALLGGAGATGFVLLTNKVIAQPFEKSTAQHKPLGKTSKYGDLMGQMLPNALYAGGMSIAGLFGTTGAFHNAGMMLMSTAYAGALATVLKYTVREGRPYDSSVRNSFPSGHTTTAFAFAGTVLMQHGWWYGGPALALATFVGYSRLNDHQHYLRDVVAGATIGLSCSLGLYYAQQEEKESPNAGGVPVEPNWRLIPQPLQDGMQLAVDYHF